MYFNYTMRVNCVSGIKFCNPIFKIGKPVVCTVPFTSVDTLDKSENLCYYNELQKDLGILSEQDVKLMAQNIKERVGDVSTEDIYYTMGVLSEYSSYKSWNKLNKFFKDLGAIHIIDGIQYKENLTQGVPINLSTVMSYLSLKNYPADYYNKHLNKSVVILDSYLLNNPIESKFDNLIYIENFENGYNFFNQSKSFEDFTVDVINQVKGGDFKQNLYKFLNREFLEKVNDLDVNPDKIVIIPQEPKTSPQEIADNLNPIIINFADFDKIIKSNPKDNGFMLDFMRNMNVFITPKQLSKDLKTMHEKIKNYTKNSENVFYTIPYTEKSFALINYMYKKINNIPDKNFIYYNKPSSIKNIPEGSYVVVLDDCSITGGSMYRERFYYENFDSNANVPSMKIILAPVYMTEYAENQIKNHCRKDDTTIYCQKLPACDSKYFRKFRLPSIIIYLNQTFLTSFILPYMGPDTNCPEFQDLYEKMLYSPDAQSIL